MKTDNEILNTMLKYGGSFVKALAEAAFHADKENLARIKRTWPEYWQNYEKMADVIADKEARTP